MFIKTKSTYNASTGERHINYKLCESYRIGDKCRQYSILWLGKLEELYCEKSEVLVLKLQTLAKRLSQLIRNKNFELLFPDGIDPVIEELAQRFYAKYLLQEGVLEKVKLTKKVVTSPQKELTLVDIASLKSTECRELGAEWICLQALQQLELPQFLTTLNWSEQEIKLALIHIVSRTIYPASEFKTTKWIKGNSSICELLDHDPKTITKDQLYNIALKLSSCKELLENHFSAKTTSLFDLQDNIVLFDLSNTYFEGRKEGSELAQFGRSKEKRTDAKLVVWAQVINCEGFLKHAQIYKGNLVDSKSLGDLIDRLSDSSSTSTRKATIVFDAGIATKENLALVEEKGYNYVCVSRQSLKDYQVDASVSPTIVYDNKGNPITLQRIKTSEGDQFMLVQSPGKQIKENSMHLKSCARFELAINEIIASLHKKHGVKKYGKVLERIGRVKEKYASVNQYFDIEVVTSKLENKQNKKGEVETIDLKDVVVANVICTKSKIKTNSGNYFIQTNLNTTDQGVNEASLWKIYNAIREIESSFRCLKTDLDIRPVFHKNDNAVEAHLNLALLAYQIVSTIRYQLKLKNITYDWREIVRIMSSQKMITTTIKNQNEETISVRQCSEPEKGHKEIYDALSYKSKFGKTKKSVVPLTRNFKNEQSKNQVFMDG